MPDPRTKPPAPLGHDDYCRIFGRIVFDAFYRIDSLEKQLGPLHENFQSQTEALRSQLAEAYEELKKVREEQAEEARLFNERLKRDLTGDLQRG